MTCLTGCTRLRVLDADKTVVRVVKGKMFHVEHDGWFVPDARWLEIMNALNDKLHSAAPKDAELIRTLPPLACSSTLFYYTDGIDRNAKTYCTNSWEYQQWVKAGAEHLIPK